MIRFRKTVRKILSVGSVVVLALLVILAGANAILSRVYNTPTFLFGRTILWVKTGSMEPTIDEKSYILVKKSDGKNLAEGDIITFLCTDTASDAYGYLVTHRIAEVTADGFYKTKGDNNSIDDSWTVHPDDVVSVGARNLPVLTFFGRIYMSPLGLFLIAVIFLWSCVFLYLPDLLKAMKSDESRQEAKEAEIDRRVQEEVKKMLANGKNSLQDDKQSDTKGGDDK